MVQSPQFERVSSQLQATLDREAIKISTDKKDEVANLLHSQRILAHYNSCIWWDGCYYCQDEHKDWYCIKCTFF